MNNALGIAIVVIALASFALAVSSDPEGTAAILVVIAFAALPTFFIFWRRRA